MQKVIKKLTDKNLYFSLLITLVFFAIFIKIEYATDSYSLFSDTVISRINHFMLSGRFITALWWALVNAFHFSDYLIYLSSFILALLCITLSIYNLFLVINKKVKNKFICLVVSTITIINPFTIELFLFLEKGILTLAVLLSVLAFAKFVKYLEGDKKSLKYVFLFMFIATFSYQGVIGLFIALSTVYIVGYSTNVKEFIKCNIIVLLGYGIPAIINLLIIRLFFSNNRVSGAINFTESIQKISEGSEKMFQLYNILPKYTFQIAVVVLIVLTIALLFINYKEKLSKKLLKLLGVIYVIIITLGLTIVPQLMQNTESIWFVPRSTYPFGAIVGIICIFVLVNIISTDKLNNVKKSSLNNINKIIYNLAYIVLGIISITLLILELYNFNKIEIDHYILNYLDKTNCLSIGEEIQKYERETGNKVTKICIYKDKEISFTYKGLWVSQDINISGFYADWAITDMINYYNNLDLTNGKVDEEIKQNFSEQDWDKFNTEQIIFINDTLHYCRF